jgi:hypothetical protein
LFPAQEDGCMLLPGSFRKRIKIAVGALPPPRQVKQGMLIAFALRQAG